MKKSQILVLTQGATALQLASGDTVQAVLPVRKGESYSYALTKTGKVVTIKGARINGVGVARFFSENGYAADPESEAANTLADEVDIRDGASLVEQAIEVRAKELQTQFAGKECTFVPFREGDAWSATVDPAAHFHSVLLGLGTEISSALVKTVYREGDIKSMNGFNLAHGWVVGPDENPEDFQKVSDYGDLIEYVTYVLANAGLGKLEGNPHLEFDEADDADPNFMRGKLTLRLTNGDALLVGANAVDELVVQYVRNNEVIYSREGFTDMKPRVAIGCVAAVLVRVNEMDAQKPKKAPRAKKVAA